MTPPPTEELVPRLFLGPALRTQPDRRLVGLVRDGYEAAFEEIVRRYAGQLRRYAGAIVGARAEDVIQDAFSKALQALRRDDGEIELRPWLYRIVRNTALNDLRDRPPSALALAESIEGSRGVAEEVERREELAELIDRLRALPEPQRAAIVMRELEGLGHEEIAAALGITGGAARQAIHRARTALRNGFGMAIPLPVLRAMLEGGAQPAEVAAGGAGAGIVLKAATATVLVAGTFGAGVALHDRHGDRRQGAASESASASGSAGSTTHPGTVASTTSPAAQGAVRGRSGNGSGNNRDRGSGSGSGNDSSGASRSGGRSASGRHSGPRSEGSGPRSGPSQPASSGQGGRSPNGGSGEGDSGSGSGSLPNSGSGQDGSGSGNDGGSGGGEGPEPGEPQESTGGLESNSGPGSGEDGSNGGGGSGSDSGDSRDSQSGGGFTQSEPQP